MSRFDRTEARYIKEKINEEIALPQIGTVVEVREHTDPDDFSNFECDVLLRDEQTQRRGALVASPANGNIMVPSEGDLVMVQFLDGEGERPVITRTLYTNERRPPLGEEGIHREKKRNLYYEAAPNGEWIRLAHKDTDDGPPNSEIGVREDGEIFGTGIEQEFIVYDNGNIVSLGANPTFEDGQVVDPGHGQIMVYDDGNLVN